MGLIKNLKKNIAFIIFLDFYDNFGGNWVKFTLWAYLKITETLVFKSIFIKVSHFYQINFLKSLKNYFYTDITKKIFLTHQVKKK